MYIAFERHKFTTNSFRRPQLSFSSMNRAASDDIPAREMKQELTSTDMNEECSKMTKKNTMIHFGYN